MKYLLIVIAFLGTNSYAQLNTTMSNMGTTQMNSDLVFAETGIPHYLQATGDDSLTVQAGNGLNLLSGSSVQIQAGNDGYIGISTSNTSDIDIMAGGNVVLWALNYQVITYGESALIQTDHGLQIQPNSTQPVCDSTRRGLLFYVNGDTGVADSLQVCAKLSDDSYAYRPVF